MRKSAAAVSVCVLCSCSATQDRDKGAPPQGRPVAVLLRAIQEQDVRLLESAFSSRMRERLGKNGWQAELRAYTEVFRTEFGEYRLEDFSYVFAGDDAAGTVAIVFRGRKLPGMRVVREEGQWKLDER